MYVVTHNFTHRDSARDPLNTKTYEPRLREWYYEPSGAAAGAEGWAQGDGPGRVSLTLSQMMMMMTTGRRLLSWAQGGGPGRFSQALSQMMMMMTTGRRLLSWAQGGGPGRFSQALSQMMMMMMMMMMTGRLLLSALQQVRDHCHPCASFVLDQTGTTSKLAP